VTSDARPGISGLTPDALATWVEAGGEPSYRARQIADAVWKDGGVTDAAAIRTLPEGFRATVANSPSWVRTVSAFALIRSPG